MRVRTTFIKDLHDTMYTLTASHKRNPLHICVKFKEQYYVTEE